MTLMDVKRHHDSGFSARLLLGSLLLLGVAVSMVKAEDLKQKFLSVDQETCLASCGFDLNSTLVITDPSAVETITDDANAASKVIRILSYDAGMDLMGRQRAADLFFAKTGIKVQIDLIPDFLGLYDEIRSQAERKLPLYDGYICGPAIVGSAVQLDGWLDLTEIVRDHAELQWLDVLRGFRENIAVYDNKVRMFPLDGDAHFLYYRKDVLEAFNQPVPRTWDEYWQVAKAIHGKEYNGQTMVGSCVGRKLGAQLAYWASLVLSSYTQTSGASQGFILDAQDMTPLMGEAMAETLKMLEYQAMYGHPREFETGGGGDASGVNVEAMNGGYCALTYNWGDSYKQSHTSDPESHVIGLLQVAPTPGATKVYNRKTKRLEACNEDNCGSHEGGIYYDDIGWVNRASYLAFGGWSAAINKNTDAVQQQMILDFFIFMCSPEISIQAAIPNATAPLVDSANGVDPFRISHMNVQKWVDQGFERTSVETYKQAVEETLGFPNAAYDMRFAGADLIYSALEEEVYNYLEQAVLLNKYPEHELERQKIRLQVANTLETKFREIIKTEDSKAETLVPLLEQFQRDLGIYKPPSEDDSKLAVFITIPIVISILLGAAAIVYFRSKEINDDSVWQVKKEDIVFSDPQKIIGTGTFGMVLLAEYRGTKVAVKRVLPPSTIKNSGLGKTSGHTVCSGSGTSFASETDPSGGHDEEQGQMVGTDSWGAANISGLCKSGSPSTRNMGHSRKASMSTGKKSSDLAKRNKTLKHDFIKEMRYISKLRHPCITTVMGAVISPNDEPMLIMEYMEHGSLHDILHNETMVLEGEILLPMLCDITQGCRFLHSADPQVIHGDLKAANILVDSKFRAKVADFGLSQKRELGATGTPFWMAPELLRHESQNTAASDVYSFGIILYEAFSRKDPYEGEDPREVLKQVADRTIAKRPPVPQGCPSQLAALMEDCLLDNPDERPTFEELDKRLRRVDIEDTNNVKTGMSSEFKPKTTVSLFDIFPKHIAEALRDGKQVEPEHKDVVTIFFSDIVGFTTISSTLAPRKVANMLDRLYQRFDKLSNEHDIFKVETIGDAYMAVTNLVKDQPDDHAVRIAEFAVNAIKAANETLIDTDDPEKGFVNIRVGFHSGPVVADVVGSRNPRYCLFGDTVNVASRMESNSKVNRIHCSRNAADILKDQNCKLPIRSRGIINIKGKGEMHTYWINEAPKPSPVLRGLEEGNLEVSESALQPAKESAPESALSTDQNQETWRQRLEKGLNETMTLNHNKENC